MAGHALQPNLLQDDRPACAFVEIVDAGIGPRIDDRYAQDSGVNGAALHIGGSVGSAFASVWINGNGGILGELQNPASAGLQPDLRAGIDSIRAAFT